MAKLPLLLPNSVIEMQRRTPKSHHGTREGLNTQFRNELSRRMDPKMFSCDFPTFRDHYLPFVPSDDEVRGAIADLVDKRILARTNLIGGYIWTVFGVPPSALPNGEQHIFVGLNDITIALAEYNMGDRLARFRYRNCPNTSVTSEVRGMTFKIDGYFESKDQNAATTIVTAPIAVMLKYTSFGEDKFENRKQLLSAANQIIYDDPRRTAVYGIMIEGDKMSIWFFCHSHSVVCEEFNFVMETTYAIQCFLSFIFALEKEIGYDSRILRRDSKGRACYVCKIESRYFMTNEDVFSYQPFCINDSMTRVWEAFEVDNPMLLLPITDSPVAIKNVWIRQGKKNEHETQIQVFESMRLEGQQEYSLSSPRFADLDPGLKSVLETCLSQRTYADYFVPIECSELGAASKGKSPNAMPAAGILGEYGDVTLDAFYPYTPKQRFQVVYSDVGYCVEDAPDLVTVFKALKDITIALALLYLAGWVHRDISSGNILYFNEYGVIRAKLTDFQSAKRSDEVKRSDTKRGTPHFMALEIAMDRELYSPKPEILDRWSSPGKVKENGDDDEIILETRGPAKVIHTFRHDLESLWWVAMWFLVCCVKNTTSNIFGTVIFTGNIEPTHARVDLFTEPARVKIGVHPDMLPLLQLLQSTSQVFCTVYSRRRHQERDRTHDDEDFCTLHSAMWNMLDGLIEKAQLLGDKGRIQLPYE